MAKITFARWPWLDFNRSFKLWLGASFQWPHRLLQVATCDGSWLVGDHGTPYRCLPLNLTEIRILLLLFLFLLRQILCARFLKNYWTDWHEIFRINLWPYGAFLIRLTFSSWPMTLTYTRSFVWKRVLDSSTITIWARDSRFRYVVAKLMAIQVLFHQISLKSKFGGHIGHYINKHFDQGH